MRGREKFERFRPLIYALKKMEGAMPRGIRESLWAWTDGWRGKLGLAIRYAAAKSSAKECGGDVHLDFSADIGKRRLRKKTWPGGGLVQGRDAATRGWAMP